MIEKSSQLEEFSEHEIEQLKEQLVQLQQSSPPHLSNVDTNEQ